MENLLSFFCILEFCPEWELPRDIIKHHILQEIKKFDLIIRNKVVFEVYFDFEVKDTKKGYNFEIEIEGTKYSVKNNVKYCAWCYVSLNRSLGIVEISHRIGKDYHAFCDNIPVKYRYYFFGNSECMVKIKDEGFYEKTIKIGNVKYTIPSDLS